MGIMPLDPELARRHLRPMRPLPTGRRPGGRLRGPVRAVLFDVYGTLLISAAGDIGSAPARCGDSAGPLPGLPGAPSLPSAETDRRLKRRIGEIHAAMRARGVDVPEVEIDRVWRDILPALTPAAAREAALRWELATNPVWPMPGMRATVDGCRERGLVLGIVSNAQFYTPLLLKWFLGKPLSAAGFAPALRIYSYRLGRAKPSPVLFEAAAAGLARRGIAPQAALHVGNDMLNDVWAAARAGFQTALFAGDARSLRLREDDPRCRDRTPELIVTDLAQLMAHLE